MRSSRSLCLPLRRGLAPCKSTNSKWTSSAAASERFELGSPNSADRDSENRRALRLSIGTAILPVILIVVAIAIPNSLKARIAANQASAVGSLRTINTAEMTCASTFDKGIHLFWQLSGLPPAEAQTPALPV
jgi:hypothetical protein